MFVAGAHACDFVCNIFHATVRKIKQSGDIYGLKYVYD